MTMQMRRGNLSGIDAQLTVQCTVIVKMNRWNRKDAKDAKNSQSMAVSEANACSRYVIGAAIKVHSALGPGLLESTYETCMAYELRKRGSTVQTQLPLPVVYDGVHLNVGYRIDMLVDKCVIVELKTVRRIRPIHEAQLLSYLRLSGVTIGLLINFHVPLLKVGIKRMVNKL